ncbi:Hypothetical_protein [Hexamita inflata]|uniref:Hypothetical_protein n=1 Tax=Hexamita inflata TaxID=28002 RepID=A0AA86NBM8_9EUKA|nr:Hypothetical protein HINF_LOCUS4105 [Hexamita inflata]
MKLRQQQQKKAGMKVEILEDNNTQNYYVEMRNSITQMPPIKKEQQSIDSLRNSVKIQVRKTSKSNKSRTSSVSNLDSLGSISSNRNSNSNSNRNSVSDTTQQVHKIKQAKPKLQTIEEQPVW